VIKISQLILCCQGRVIDKAYAPNKRSLVKFKDEMFKGLYDAELKETCLLFMLNDPK